MTDFLKRCSGNVVQKGQSFKEMMLYKEEKTFNPYLIQYFKKLTQKGRQT